MNPNRPRKAAPSWIAERKPNKAFAPRNPQERREADHAARIEELKRLVRDFSIPFQKREKLASELAALMKRGKS